ncbi:phosphatase PAP2 family protein [Curtobacterium citri]|uniref:phosphatase PAP2 family protein n=1 Tax=Curtobacterium citri TaxID=3055139 RepID=UPI0025A0B034|nr:phosphatase PAP2 family protein [Curtobacterium citri]
MTASAWRRPVERAVVVVVLLVVAGLLLRGHPVDAPSAAALNGAHTGVVGALSSAVYTVFEPVPAILLTMVLTAVVWARTRCLVVAAGFAGVVALTWIPSDVLKVVVGRPRPDGSVLSHPFVPAQPDASFPSGHMVFVVALVLAALMLVRDVRRRRVWAVCGGLVIVAVATALTVDGVHWPTDVVASVVWALAVAPVARIVWVDVVLRRVTQRLEQTGRHRSGRGKDRS